MPGRRNLTGPAGAESRGGGGGEERRKRRRAPSLIHEELIGFTGSDKSKGGLNLSGMLTGPFSPCQYG